MNENENFTKYEPCGYCCTQIEKLSVSFGANRVLEDVNLHFHCGELTAVIGPNGAGKTTLLRAILGELPHEGRRHFLDAEQKRPDAPLIGYVPQRLDFDASSPISVLDLFAGAVSRWPVFLGKRTGLRQKAAEALAAVGAEKLTGRKLGLLSGGELQRVLLALSLVPVPNLLLLDEPVSSVDASGMEMFYRTVSSLRERYDLAIILVSHDLVAAARVADRMIFLNRKIICEGAPSTVLADDRVRKTFGLDWVDVENSKQNTLQHSCPLKS